MSIGLLFVLPLHFHFITRHSYHPFVLFCFLLLFRILKCIEENHCTWMRNVMLLWATWWFGALFLFCFVAHDTELSVLIFVVFIIIYFLFNRLLLMALIGVQRLLDKLPLAPSSWFSLVLWSSWWLIFCCFYFSIFLGIVIIFVHFG